MGTQGIEQGDVFAADAGNRVVLRYDKSGKLLGRIGEKNKERNVPGIVMPSPYLDVTLARDGRGRPASAIGIVQDTIRLAPGILHEPRGLGVGGAAHLGHRQPGEGGQNPGHVDGPYDRRLRRRLVEQGTKPRQRL